jgi:hypothetical protein
MSSFENPTQPSAEKGESLKNLREYFQSYITDAESQDSEEGKEAFVDSDKIKLILSDIDNGEYESAREYLDSEIVRMQGIQENMKGFDLEEGKSYLEKITNLRNSLR